MSCTIHVTHCLHVRFIVFTSSAAVTSLHFVAVDLFLLMVPEPLRFTLYPLLQLLALRRCRSAAL